MENTRIDFKDTGSREWLSEIGYGGIGGGCESVQSLGTQEE